MKKNLLLVFCCSIFLVYWGMSQKKVSSKKVENKVDWHEFLKKQDMVWEELPLQWNEGAFLGNGHIGMMAYVDMSSNAVIFHLGRQDVTEHRKAPTKKSSIGVQGANGFTDFTRLDIGKLLLKPKGQILSGRWRLNLWNAELQAELTTNLGKISFTALTAYTSNVHIIEINSTEKKGEELIKYEWTFKAARAFPPRFSTKGGDTSKYQKNPDLETFEKDGYHISEQTLLAGGDYSTVWKERNLGYNKSIVYATTANEIPAAKKSTPIAISWIETAEKEGAAAKYAHEEWWHGFYQKSFVSFPDPRLESFYWIQLYKMGVCFRPDAPAVDLFGPVFRISQWPHHWWNLNIQLTYWPVYATNHLEMGENFVTLVDENFNVLLDRFKGKVLGDFAWALHNYYWQYSFAGNWEAIKEKWMPKAIAVLNEYEHHFIKEEDGKIGLDPMSSPEYHGFELYKNTTYNLSLLRWLLNALLTVNEKTNAGNPSATQWRQYLKDLRPYPVNENGLMIGSSQPLDMSHRHFSHLLGLYPLYQLNPDDSTEKALVVKSVKHWHSIENGKALAGYSYTGAALLYASLGMGNEALEVLHSFLGDSTHPSKIHTNTMYTESGGKNPVIETPLSGATAVTDLLLQSWKNKIRIFPAVPSDWKEAVFDNLRAEGGFLVSASRKNGRTAWVEIYSTAGERCVVKVKDWKNAFAFEKNNISIKKIGEGEFEVLIKKGERILLMEKGINEKAVVNPVASDASQYNQYGIKKGEQIKGKQFWPE